MEARKRDLYGDRLRRHFLSDAAVMAGMSKRFHDEGSELYVPATEQ